MLNRCSQVLSEASRSISFQVTRTSFTNDVLCFLTVDDKQRDCFIEFKRLTAKDTPPIKEQVVPVPFGLNSHGIFLLSYSM